MQIYSVWNSSLSIETGVRAVISHWGIRRDKWLNIGGNSYIVSRYTTYTSHYFFLLELSKIKKYTIHYSWYSSQDIHIKYSQGEIIFLLS
jgi:hypothetical protein